MSSSDEGEEAPVPKRKVDLANSSIQTGKTTINTVAGPIREWLPIPENLPKHPTMAYFGKRRTGKSTSITNVAQKCCQGIPFGLVMSDTAYAGYWEQIVPKRHIVQGLRQDVLDWLIQRQSKAVAKYGVKDPRIAAFIILDDVIADQKTIRWSADLQRFFVQGRHLAITVFIASQYLKGVGPVSSMLQGGDVRACDAIVSKCRRHIPLVFVPLQTTQWRKSELHL